MDDRLLEKIIGKIDQRKSQECIQRSSEKNKIDKNDIHLFDCHPEVAISKPASREL